MEVFFDCSSPWTYLGFHNVRPMAERLGIEIDWKPILVGGVFNAINESVYEQRANPVRVKARYMGKDLQDWAKLAGLKIKFPPSIFPINSVKAMRACIALQRSAPERMVPFAQRVFEVYWSEDRDIADEIVLRECLQTAGADVDATLTTIQSNDVKAALRDNTETLIQRGGFGSPTFFVDGNMFFGNDRLPLVEAALTNTI
ncbi:MAG: 2-hydroxychromene-2-carboxylate isomerase [Pseudomonadota bacterium]